jgi:hypothetical protein
MKQRGFAMKKLIVLIALLFTAPVIAGNNPAKNGTSPEVATGINKQAHATAKPRTWVKRTALFIRDTAIGTATGLLCAGIWHVIEHSRRNNAPPAPPANPDAWCDPAPPGGLNVAAAAPPADNSNSHQLHLALLGALVGGMIGIAEVADDCIPKKPAPDAETELGKDAAMALEMQIAEYKATQNRRVK